MKWRWNGKLHGHTAIYRSLINEINDDKYTKKYRNKCEIGPLCAARVWNCACYAGNQFHNKCVCDQLSLENNSIKFSISLKNFTRESLKLRHSTWSGFLFAIIIMRIIGISLWCSVSFVCEKILFPESLVYLEEFVGSIIVYIRAVSFALI